MRNDIKLIFELNKQLFTIRADIARVQERKELFPAKKQRIVEVHDRADELVRPRGKNALPSIAADISQPFGLHDFLLELGSFAEGEG